MSTQNAVEARQAAEARAEQPERPARAYQPPQVQQVGGLEHVQGNPKYSGYDFAHCWRY